MLNPALFQFFIWNKLWETKFSQDPRGVKHAILEERDFLPQRSIDALVNGMQACFDTCILMRGGQSPYYTDFSRVKCFICDSRFNTFIVPCFLIKITIFSIMLCTYTFCPIIIYICAKFRVNMIVK